MTKFWVCYQYDSKGRQYDKRQLNIIIYHVTLYVPNILDVAFIERVVDFSYTAHSVFLTITSRVFLRISCRMLKRLKLYENVKRNIYKVISHREIPFGKNPWLWQGEVPLGKTHFIGG